MQDEDPAHDDLSMMSPFVLPPDLDVAAAHAMLAVWTCRMREENPGALVRAELSIERDGTHSVVVSLRHDEEERPTLAVAFDATAVEAARRACNECGEQWAKRERRSQPTACESQPEDVTACIQ